jgi:5,5'-dehydrodivanillate O-demethylase
MASREHEDMLGQGDIGIAWLRRIWARELQAFADGASRKTWTRPEKLWQAAMPQ